MDQNGKGPPSGGSEVAPGEAVVTSKTARPVEPQPPEPAAEERAAGAWTGQYPDAATRQAPQGGDPADNSTGTDNRRG
jgi:hypothetical protein